MSPGIRYPGSNRSHGPAPAAAAQHACVHSAGVPAGMVAGKSRRKPVKQRGWARVCAIVLVTMSSSWWRAGSARADEWKPISPEELKMKSVEGAPGAPAVILYREVNRDDGRAGHEDNYVRIKILTDEGRKYADVEIPFIKESGNVSGVKA